MKEGKPESIADALTLIEEAKSIAVDGGIKVLGWKAASPFDAAAARLQEAINYLADIPKVRKQLGVAQEAYGDLFLNSTDRAYPYSGARDHYEQAKTAFEEAEAYDDLQRVVAKRVNVPSGL